MTGLYARRRFKNAAAIGTAVAATAIGLVLARARSCGRC